MTDVQVPATVATPPAARPVPGLFVVPKVHVRRRPLTRPCSRCRAVGHWAPQCTAKLDASTFVVDPAANVGLVHFWVRKHLKLRSRDEYEDVAGAAMEGLLVACRRFDPTRGVKFGVFAWAWIRCYALRGLQAAREQKGKDKAEIPTVPLEALLHGDVADEFRDPAEALDDRTLPARMRALVDALEPSHRLIIRRRYFEGRTLAEVGEELGVSRERVRQLEAVILRAMRERLTLDETGVAA